LHSSDDDQGFEADFSNVGPGYGPGLLLELGIRAQYLDWIIPSTVWTTRFSLEIVHEASRIELIHWFDAFEEAPSNVRTGAAEVVARQMPFAGIVRWNVLDH
jgi:hypothetical protein